jgi:hypothetical protein
MLFLLGPQGWLEASQSATSSSGFLQGQAGSAYSWKTGLLARFKFILLDVQRRSKSITELSLSETNARMPQQI